LEQNLRFEFLVQRGILSRSYLRVLHHLIEEMRTIIQMLVNIRQTRMAVVVARSPDLGVEVRRFHGG
jgi:hypothetical protein